jgi:2,3-dihydroxyphenylpropionate 1,2-dioxygenase
VEIVLAIACSHAGLIETRREMAAPEQSGRYFQAADLLRKQVAEAAPDAIVIVGTDHMKAWTLAGGVPATAIGVGPIAHGLGDAGVAPRDIPINQEFAARLLCEFVEAGGSLAFREDVPIDHSFVLPLDLFDPDGDVPIVPITQNCNVPPRPTMQASYRFGQELRSAGRDVPGRVVVVATGGLSHWVGNEERRAFMDRTPGTRLPDLHRHPVGLEETGPVNDSFDRAFLEAVCAGRLMSFMGEWPDARLETEAGNGAHELRNWATISGLVDDARAEVLTYEPVAEWLTGVAIVRFEH